MKYFEMTLDNAVFPNAPRIINWYGVQDVELIKWETYHKLKNRQIYMIEPSEQRIFTDIITFPFLLVSDLMKDTIKMYPDEVVFKETILMDTEHQVEKSYYLPIMQENKEITLSYRGESAPPVKDAKVPEWSRDKNIFWILDKQKRHTIISLDLAESLLRRNIIGMQLKEVYLKL